MIEFRAECGHTIRARNEDAGKMVNCAYCGKRALVPSDEADPMDSLLADTLDESREVTGEVEQATPWGKGLGQAPLRIAWTAIFVVLVLSVLLLTVRWVYREVVGQKGLGEAAPAVATIDTTGPESTPAETVSAQPGAEPERGPSPVPPERRNPLAALDVDKTGVCVFSVPSGLDVYIEDVSVRSDTRLRVDAYRGQTSREEDLTERLNPGHSYRVSVVANMRNPDLRDYPDYPSRELLTRARLGDFEGAADIAEGYFIEDGAKEWRVERRGPHYYLIKTYQVDTLSREGDWRPVYSLFVPQVSCPELLNYVSGGPRFVYDLRLAEQELRDWGLARSDYPAVLSALSRIGKAVVTDAETGTIRVFQVWPDKSVVGEPLMGNQIPPEP